MMIVALFPIASALSEGQILSQDQVNNFPIDNYDTINSLVTLLQCQKYSGFNFLWNHNWFYVKPFDCLQLDKRASGDYIIHRETYFARFKIEDYRDCITTLDDGIPLATREGACEDWVIDNMRDFGKNKIWKIKAEIIDYQDETDSGTTFGNDFGGDLF